MGEHQGGRISLEWVPDEGARAPGQRGMRDRGRIRRKGFGCEWGDQSSRRTQDDDNYWETVVRNVECVCVPDRDCNCVIL